MASFLDFLQEKHPQLKQIPDLDRQLRFFISKFHLKVPAVVLKRIEDCVKNIVAYAHSADHLTHLRESATETESKILSAKAPQKSALCAFDFHYHEENDQLSLIEINTNASAFLAASSLYEYRQKTPLKKNPEKLLFESFQNEADLFDLKDPVSVFVIDENIRNQKMFFEFLMYEDFFQRGGWKAKILDFSEVPNDSGVLIYNRYCDFLLERPESSLLLQQFLSGQNLFTPSPKEYLLMAAKDRLDDFARANVSEAIVPSKRFNEFASSDAIWEDRRSYYFKPRRSYGGKAVFRGASISRKRFDELDPKEYVAQESRPPGVIDDWKFDLRAYTYGDEVQMIVARLFQGQLLNFSTEDGGLSTVEFTDISKIAVEKS